MDTERQGDTVQQGARARISIGSRGWRLSIRWRLLASATLAMTGALLVGCSGSPTGTVSVPQQAATATPAATSTPQVLYVADWSHGAGGWALPADWSVQGGQLTNNGSGDTPLPMPFVVTASQYSVAIQVQVLGYVAGPSSSQSDNEYGIIAEDANGGQLYFAGVSEIDPFPPHHSFLLLTTSHGVDLRSSIATQDFVPGGSMRSYAVTVDGNSATFVISDATLGTITASIPFAPAHLFLDDHHVKLAVASAMITTP